jgi:predicted  nucleic acid-binding Zn-ribbon protein
MKKNDPQTATQPATLAELAAELEATQKRLARTERKLERETATARLWFNTLDETKQDLARTRADLAAALAARDRAQDIADRAQDITDRALNRADRLQNLLEHILGIKAGAKATPAPDGIEAARSSKGETEPRHRRRWHSWRSRRK